MALIPNHVHHINFQPIPKGGHIKINLKSEIPVQVDGEPWVAAPSEVVVLKSALKVHTTHSYSVYTPLRDLNSYFMSSKDQSVGTFFV